MKILIVADLHLKEDKYGLLDLKLEIGQSLLQKMIDQVDYFVFAGDTQDNRGGYDSYLATKEAEMYASVGKENQHKIYVLTGNHDSRLRSYHQISPYAVGTKINIVAEEPVTLSDNRCNVILQGWNGGDKLPEPTGRSFYVGHLNVKDLIGKGVTYQEIEASGFTRVISGDYHKNFENGKFYSVGTLFPSSFNDKEYEPTFIIFDTDTNTIKSYQLPPQRYPRFKVYSCNFEEVMFLTGFKDNIIRIKIKTDELLDREARTRIKDHYAAARYVDLQIEANKKELIEVEKSDKPLKMLENASIAQGWTENQLNLGRELVSFVTE